MSGRQLKWIALLTMVLDHFGASVMTCLIIYHNQAQLKPVYYLIRNIGRIAFPLYCFFIVEGLLYTSNLKKYIVSLFLGAVISEIPFDLAVGRTNFPYFEHQNVYFTLFIGLLVITIIRFAQTNFLLEDIRRYIIIAAASAFGCYLAYLMKSDYKWGGVATIVGMYLIYDFLNLRRDSIRDKQAIYFMTMLLGCAIIICYSENEVYCLVDALIMIFYNGKRGNIKHKYFYYLAYPVHLLILGLAVWMIPLNVQSL